MSTIVLRGVKGSRLTEVEGDANFSNLNNDKYESGDIAVFNTLGVGTLGTELTVDASGNISTSGTLTASGYNKTNWDSAHGWGDHSTFGYLTAETDPTVPAEVKAITSVDITNWNNAHGWGNHANFSYLTSETDPVFTASPAGGILAGDITNWDTAFGWGNPSGVYLPLSANGATTGKYTINNNAGFSIPTASDTLTAGFQILQPTAGADAAITFHVGSDYAAHFGLSGGLNDFVVGGWSMGAVEYLVHHDGNYPVSQVASNSTLVQRNASGYILCNYINTTANVTTAVPTNIWVETDSDSYHRKQTPASFRANVTDGVYAPIIHYGTDVLRQDGVYVEPLSFPQSAHWKFTESSQLNTPPGTGSWRHVLTIQGWTAYSSSYPSYQMSFGAGAIGVRQATSATVWDSWKTLAYREDTYSRAGAGGNITISASAASGGVDGDLWFKV